ncbi:MarR family transcriptional regulator [Paucilactobacillus suebicus DSM 5007 = KCTC 3549]|uniref:MarR family transcriptional regulator n=2 Tax=Paucilactobacillus suebicus TaxID=152335 RepID=A0A0R1W7H9_9LACO|nr:MarR family transcriptional regulator [Paucilactobacillus suebicus DSM 5007 = KCTC 3549]
MITMASEDLLNKAINLYMSTLKSLDSFISEPATKYYLSFEQYLILHDIATQKKIMLMDIADQRQVTRSAISRQIKVLLKHKYVYQRADPNDRRRLFLHLTKEGKRVEAEISDNVTDRFSGWVQIFGEDKAQEVIQLLEDFGELIVKQEAEKNTSEVINSEDER